MVVVGGGAVIGLLVLMVRRLVVNVAPGSPGVTGSESSGGEAGGEGMFQAD